MENRDIIAQLEQINQKLNVIMEEIELQRRQRREIEDLKNHISSMRDAYKSELDATVKKYENEIERIKEVSAGDIVREYENKISEINKRHNAEIIELQRKYETASGQIKEEFIKIQLTLIRPEQIYNMNFLSPK